MEKQVLKRPIGRHSLGATMPPLSKALIIASLAIALLGAVFQVSGQEYPVPLDLAMNHAATAFIEYTAFEVPPLVRGGEGEPWRAARIGEPLVLFDMTREPLFYSFPVLMEGRAQVGSVWISASKLLGSTAASFVLGPPGWNVEEGMAWAEEIAAEQYPGWEIVSLHVVVYSYPKIGVLATILNPQTREEVHLTVDIADRSVIPILEPDSELKGTGSWSFYESIPR